MVISEIILVEQSFAFSSLISRLICRIFILTQLYLGMWFGFYAKSSHFLSVKDYRLFKKNSYAMNMALD